MTERDSKREPYSTKNQQVQKTDLHKKDSDPSPPLNSDAYPGGNETQRFTDKKFIPTMDRSSNLERDAQPEKDTNVWRAVSKPHNAEPGNPPYGYEVEDPSWDDSVGRWETRTIDLEREGEEGDPLAELRMIATREARALQEYPNGKDEMYYVPPTPVKRRQEEVKEVRMPRKRSKVMKAEKETSESSAAEVESSGFKSFNDFDEDIFKFDQATKMYICPRNDCDKAFPSLSRIKRHYIIHTDIKPFKCLNPGCFRRFSRKDNMLQHCRVHCQYAGDVENHK